ncbi:MAG: deiodinase family protein, partial [Planctomycetes bacterium]|nr:deiodinase family protein [Planctomycetota bacterium]
ADIEAVQMLTAVIGGSQMGPGEGWFHPGKSRYGWQWLAARYDRDGNGVISAEEFSGPAESFRQLDRDHNGELAALDFDWSDMSPFVRQQGQAGQWFGRIDKSSNGRISAEEWQLFFQTLAGEKGYLSREDLRSGFFPPAPKSSGPPQPGQEGPSTATLLQGIFSGELGSLRAGPAIDDPAPDFELETQDHSQKIRLSRFRNDRPVVLIFGSFT